MFDKKNPLMPLLVAALSLFGVAIFLTGCTPAGPAAVLKGKKYLERGNLPEAIAQFERAKELLPTNAAAWNYYGVALQRAGQAGPAADALQRALALNRNLVEAHFNLGCALLDQNRNEAAKAEFITYNSLRHNSDPNGWLKLGIAQLRLGDIAGAEKSFVQLRDLSPNDPEADNGLGLARIQRKNPQDAMKFFAAARQKKPDFAPAILNLATTSYDYLNDKKSALDYFRAYLALNPRPANWNEVNVIASTLEQQFAPPPVVAKPTPPPPAKPTVVAETKPANPAPVRTNIVVATRPAVVAQRPPVTVKTVTPSPAPAPPPNTTQIVQVKSPEKIVAPVKANEVVTPESIEVPMPAEPEKKGFFARWFGGNEPKVDDRTKSFDPKKLTPLPAPGSNDEANLTPTKPAETAPRPEPEPPRFMRYVYLSPHAPEAGDRRSASGAFTKAREYEQQENWVTAMRWYQQAAEMDPSWFEAQFNTGVIAHRLRNFPLALPCYENALAIQPESVDARYNFALALKAAGFPVDAAEELKKILSIDNKEVRAHLAVANLYAQTIKDKSQARQHYLQVLKLDPDNSQAENIRGWLNDHP